MEYATHFNIKEKNEPLAMLARECYLIIYSLIDEDHFILTKKCPTRQLYIILLAFG